MHTRKKPPQTRHRNGYNQTRDGVPYYRRPIPDDLKARFGVTAKKPEFLRCLRSMTYEEAEAEYLRIAGLMPGEAPRDLQPVAPVAPWPPDFDEGYLKHLARRGGKAFREHVAGLDSWAGEARARVALGIVKEEAHVAALETQAAKYERLTRQARGEKVAPTVTLRVAAERFLRTVNAPSTLRQYKPRLEDVMAALGADRDISTVSKADCRQFAQETIHRVPQHWRKRWPTLALGDAIKKAEADSLPTIAHETKYGIVVLMRRFFAWCEEEGLVQVSPARGAPSPKGRRGRRSDFSTHHLKQVFSSAPYTPDKREADPALFWAFPLGLFSGMRRAEMAFMRKEDLRHERGVWFFDLREDKAAGRKLKTASSIRSVPVHPTLEKLGLIDYVKALPAGSWLFPGLHSTKRPDDCLGKRWAAQLDKLDIKDPGLTLHSTRHSFASACRDCGIEKRFSDRLGGWSTGGVAEAYGKYDLKTLARELEKLHYDLDLSHLYTRTPERNTTP